LTQYTEWIALSLRKMAFFYSLNEQVQPRREAASAATVCYAANARYVH
jgi:hypothetical protein